MATAFRIQFNAAQEVGTGSNSTATGLGTVVFDNVTTRASYTFSIAGLDFGVLLNAGGVQDTPGTTNDNVTLMHVHNAPRGANGPVAFDLLPRPGQDADDFAFSANVNGTRTFSGIWETTDPATTSLNNFAAVLAAAVPGSDVPLYFNIHSVQFGGGVIRAQWVTIADDNANTVNGTSGVDFLPGLGGDDILIGGREGDTLTGGSGADIFRYLIATDSQAAAPDTITDLETNRDKIDLTAVSPTVVSLNRSGTATTLFATTPGGPMVINAAGDVNGWDLLIGTLGIDIVGHAGGEQQIGTARSDRLFGLGGNDTLHGLEGGDTLEGGRGIDLLFGWEGADIFLYSDPADSFFSTGYDTIGDYQAGLDVIDISGFTPNAISIVRAGINSFIFATVGNELFEIAIAGSVQGEDVIAVKGLDMVGQNGVDETLNGTFYNDRLFGQGGADVLKGGSGADQLYGGAGADTFRYTFALDSVASARDFIFDFQTGIDKIDLRGTGVTAVGVANGIVFGSGPGVAMQIAVVGTIALSDILIGPTPRELDDVVVSSDLGPQEQIFQSWMAAADAMPGLIA